MKNYLSFGGGVNSVALYLYLLEEDVDFEAIFVDHQTDLPETYEYIEKFKSKYPLTILNPSVKGKGKFYSSLYDYCWDHKMMPSRARRWCTAKFKRNVVNNYQKAPAMVMIGFDFGEAHRARIYTDKGREFRYPLIEAEIDRLGCKELIKQHGLRIPPKSGCYICPFQRMEQLRYLRRAYPDLFCKLESLEDRNNKKRAESGLLPYYSFKRPVRQVVEKNMQQRALFKEDEFPPCECMI